MLPSCKLGSARRATARAFSLIELLVVLAIVGMLAALLMPAVQTAREASRRTACFHRLRQLSLAALNHASAHHGRLPATWRTGHPEPWDNFSWRATLLPFLEHHALFDRLELHLPPHAGVNRDVVRVPIETFTCRSTPDLPRHVSILGRPGEAMHELSAAPHDVVAIHDILSPQRGYPYRGAWHGGSDFRIGYPLLGDVPLDAVSAGLRSRSGRLTSIVDGLSKTGLLVEQAGKPRGLGQDRDASRHSPSEGAWATCDVGSFHGTAVNTHNYYAPFGYHAGAVTALCDGSVMLLPESTPREMLAALFSRDGSEIIDDADWR